MKSAVLAFLVCAAVYADAQKLTYTKEFPGSVPPWVGIEVERSGEAIYKEAKNEDDPIKIKLRQQEADEIFQLVEKLDKLAKPLESNLKVANMGMKTFRFEDGAVKNEVKFNYSLDENAKLLADWFEKIAESEQHFIRLERSVKFDRLGVNQALLQFQAAYERKRIVAAEQYLPLLDRVAKNDSYMHMARERAAALASSIRGQNQASSQ